MKKLFCFVVFLAVSVFGQSLEKITPALHSVMLKQNQENKILVWVFFNDKGTDIDRYFSYPTSVVSEKSLKRRLKDISLKGSALDITDLPVNETYVNGVQAAGLTVKQKTRWFNGVSGYTTKENLSRIASLPFVTKIDVVQLLKKEPEVIDINKPSGLPKLEQPEGIASYNYGTSYTQLQQINVPAVHDLGFKGQGVTICVMDAGFNRLTHESFAGMNIIAMWDFVNGDPNVGDEGDMGTGVHGTQTLSTIGGFKEGQLIGPAFDADFILAKTENTDSETPVEEDNWIAAMEWADSIGVDVTSTSLGYLVMDPGYAGYTYLDMDGNTAIITKGADLATHKGIVVVNSAGNEGYNGTPNTLSAPADGDSVIAIGAVYSDGSRVGFSGYGPTVDGRIKPDVMAMGSDVYVASPYSNTQYTYSSGTSFSCPLSAGVAALVLCRNPNLTPMQVREAMRNTASKAFTPDNYYGWGILNALMAINYWPVPVELTSFEAIPGSDRVQLRWTTATESNNRGFEIQRMGTDNKWQVIGFKEGKGNSTTPVEYSYADKNLANGNYSYRLKQIDYNGDFSYSKVVSASVEGITSFALYPNYPNPFNPSTTIKFALPERAVVSLKLYNILGSEVKTLLNREMEPGMHSYVLDARDLSTGVYFVAMRSENFKQTIKINLIK